MTDEKIIRRMKREALMERIFDLTLELTEERLTEIPDKDKKDNMSFDRLARTAQALIRAADEISALARKSRNEGENDQSGAGADNDAYYERQTAEIVSRVSRHLGGRECAVVAGDRQTGEPRTEDRGA
jgi:hypothetical protein